MLETNENIWDQPVLQHNLKGHKSEVTAVEFNPSDRNQFVSSSKDRTLMLWNLARDVRCFKFLGHRDAVTSVAYSSNGSLLASSSLDHTARLWKPSIRGESYEIKAHSAAVTSVAFSPDNGKIVTGSYDKSIKLWDVPRRRFITSYTGHTSWVRCVRFTDEGRLLVSCADDKTVRVWDVRSGQCTHVYATIKGSGNCLAIHNNGHSLAVALSSGSVRIYDIRHKKLLQHYILHDNTTSLSWHPSSGFLLTAGKDKNIRIVDVLEGKPIYTLTGHEGGVNCISFDKTGEHFVSADSDRHVLVWKVSFKRA